MSEIAPWVFVIDTEQYAGNFERQLTAWITGRYGECEVGDDVAKEALTELTPAQNEWFEAHVLSMPDEHGCNRPTAIWPTPGWFNSGHGDHWRVGADPERVRDSYIKAIRATYEGYIKQTQNEQGKEQLRKTLAEREAAGPGTYPAYQSVAIFLDEEPPADIIKIMKERAATFKPGEFIGTLTITGFRLISQRVEQVARSI